MKSRVRGHRLSKWAEQFFPLLLQFLKIDDNDLREACFQVRFRRFFFGFDYAYLNVA